MTSKIILCFDYGTKNIGLAIGQKITCNSYPLTSIKVKNGIPNWKEIECLIKKWQPSLLVIGLPVNMDGTEQYFTKKVRKFAICLKNNFNIKYKFQDERLSTVEAKNILFKQGGYRALNDKKKIHSFSAAIILNYWFDNYIK